MARKRTDIDRAPIMLRRTMHGLSPVASFDTERLDQYGIGSTVEVSIKQRRSLPQQRMWWAILARVVENVDGWPTSDHLHDAIKMHLGYTQKIKTVDGRVAWRADSTAFANMDAAEFKTFMSRGLDLISTDIMPGVDPMSLLAEGADHVGLEATR